jgi:hypothetical protein
MTIPKAVAEKYRLGEKVGKGYFEFLFLETDKGILLVPLEKLLETTHLARLLEEGIPLVVFDSERVKKMVQGGKRPRRKPKGRN